MHTVETQQKRWTALRAERERIVIERAACERFMAHAQKHGMSPKGQRVFDEWLRRLDEAQRALEGRITRLQKMEWSERARRDPRFVRVGTGQLGRGHLAVGYLPDEHGCWLWVGAHSAEGHGHIREPKSRRMRLAHRFMFEQATGLKLQDAILLYHTCGTKGCVRPDHLVPVTAVEGTVLRKMKKRHRAVEQRVSAK